MYHQNPPYPGYQAVPAPSMRPPTHPPPPLSIPGHPPHQYPPYGIGSSPATSSQIRQQPQQQQQQQQMPPSPSEASERDGSDEAIFHIPGPKPTSHLWDDYIWTLEIRQHPQRARMCGFGDKDRRPISPPPCIRLVIYHPSTMQEVNYETFSEIDLIHLVLTVDIWDLHASREMNLVKQSNASPCISSAATGAYPTTAAHNPPNHNTPQPYNVDHLPGYSHQYQSPSTPSTSNTYYPPSAQGYQQPRQPYLDGRNGHASPYQNGSPAYPRPSYPYTDPRYGPSQPQTPQSGYGGSQLPGINAIAGMEHTYVHSPPASTQLYTRNLIGSLCASAFRLKDEKDKWGIWFVLQDLSVRTEGWFRLKCSFFNITYAVHKQLENATNGTPAPAPSPAPATATTTATTTQPPPPSTGDTAPCLASTFSYPFRVYSAKKFPGVVESTPLSKAFAAQGIKIPIRKDTGGKRGREDSEDEASDE